MAVRIGHWDNSQYSVLSLKSQSQMLPGDVVGTLPKSLTNAIYAVPAMFLCLSPVLVAAGNHSARGAWLKTKYKSYFICCLFGLIFCGCFWFGHGADSINFFLVMLGSAVLFAFVQGRFDLLAFVALFTVLFVSRMLIWWRQAEGPLFIDNWEISEIALILIFVMAVLNEWVPFESSATGPSPKQQIGIRTVSVALLLLITALASFSVVLPALPFNAYTGWHHWSVYVAAVELLRAGAVPFKDFPVQYGLGPTLLIDFSSGNDPWSAMPMLTSLLLVLETALIAGIVCVVVETKRGISFFAIALLGSAGSCLTWIAWPPELGIATLAPSGAGMRYAPFFLQVLFLLWAGKNISRDRYRRAGHFIWALASLWAPETFLYATAVWGPYYLWQRSAAGGVLDVSRAFSALMTLALVMLGTVIIFLALFWLQFKTLPSWYGYFAYMVDEPAPMDMAVRGSIWILITIFFLSGITLFEALRHRPKEDTTRNFFITLCASLASLLIFTGRSHENNFLIALPMIFVMLLCGAASTQKVWLRRSWYALFACSLAYWPLFNCANWAASVDVARSEGIASVFDSRRLTDAMSFMTPEGQRVLDAHRPQSFDTKVNSTDVAVAVAAITAQYHEPITVYDFNYVMLNGDVARGWNAIQDPAAFLPLSSNRRLGFIAATADRLRQPGWFVVNRMWKWKRPVLLDAMDSAYDEDKQLEFGTYYAIRFVPKVMRSAHP
jgi:hypothetical protein